MESIGRSEPDPQPPPFERLPVDAAVAPDPAATDWITPRLRPGEQRKVVTGIPGKTGVVYTLDRETGEFLWATPTITQNIISDIDGATGEVQENAEIVFTGNGQEVLACRRGSAVRTGRLDRAAPAEHAVPGPRPRRPAERLTTAPRCRSRDRGRILKQPPQPPGPCPTVRLVAERLRCIRNKCGGRCRVPSAGDP